MVKITINGTKQEREFQNMAQALAFAYQNGACYVAQKIEFVSDAKPPEAKKEEQPNGAEQETNPAPENSGGTSNPTAANTEKPLEEMNRKELAAYVKAKGYKISIWPTTKDAEIIAAIKAIEEKAAQEKAEQEVAAQNIAENEKQLCETCQNAGLDVCNTCIVLTKKDGDPSCYTKKEETQPSGEAGQPSGTEQGGGGDNPNQAV